MVRGVNATLSSFRSRSAPRHVVTICLACVDALNWQHFWESLVAIMRLQQLGGDVGKLFFPLRDQGRSSPVSRGPSFWFSDYLSLSLSRPYVGQHACTVKMTRMLLTVECIIQVIRLPGLCK